MQLDSEDVKTSSHSKRQQELWATQTEKLAHPWCFLPKNGAQGGPMEVPKEVKIEKKTIKIVCFLGSAF